MAAGVDARRLTGRYFTTVTYTVIEWATFAGPLAAVPDTTMA